MVRSPVTGSVNTPNADAMATPPRDRARTMSSNRERLDSDRSSSSHSSKRKAWVGLSAEQTDSPFSATHSPAQDVPRTLWICLASRVSGVGVIVRVCTVITDLHLVAVVPGVFPGLSETDQQAHKEAMKAFFQKMLPHKVRARWHAVHLRRFALLFSLPPLASVMVAGVQMGMLDTTWSVHGPSFWLSVEAKKPGITRNFLGNLNLEPLKRTTTSSVFVKKPGCTRLTKAEEYRHKQRLLQMFKDKRQTNLVRHRVVILTVLRFCVAYSRTCNAVPV